jgi:hypothetical protein
MRNVIVFIGLCGWFAGGCETAPLANVKTGAVAGVAVNPAPAPAPVAITDKKLFMDVHELGPGKVTAEDAARAHQKDLSTEGKYGVDYKAYWVDERQGKIFCLVEAPSAEAASRVHREAHGLVATKISEVLGDTAAWQPTRGKRLFMDVHHFGAGKVTAADVAAAHKQDLLAGPKHDVKYLNYWMDPASGTVMCLSEAPNAEAALATHQEAHGLVPDAIEEVLEGR